MSELLAKFAPVTPRNSDSLRIYANKIQIIGIGEATYLYCTHYIAFVL